MTMISSGFSEPFIKANTFSDKTSTVLLLMEIFNDL
jgi:hypothetical protein